MNNSAEIFLQVRDLLIQFHSKNRKHDAVKRVSFDIFKGEIFSIVGESGSGKTTIARAIAGVQTIKDGSIYMNSKILRGHPPSLYKINQAINHELSLLEHNNIWISKNLNNYVTNLKITYYKYFTNKKYHHLKNELTVYHHQNFILTKDEELFKVKILNFNKNETYFKFCKNGYQENSSLLKSITKKYQRINIFLFNLHHHIETLPLSLETTILSRNKIILAMIQKNILLASNIYHLFLELETAKTNFQNNLTLANAKCFYQTSFSKLAQLFKYHEQFLTNIKNIVKEQQSTFIFFVPLAQRKKYFLTYHHKYIVSKHKLYKTYNDKINSLQQNENNDKNIITALKNQFEMIWMKTTFSLETIEMWLQKIASINNNDNISQYLEKLAFNDESNLLKTHLFSLLKAQDNDHSVITKYLKDLRYLAKYDVFCDYHTISWYHSLLDQKYEISPDEFLTSYVLLDLLDLPPVDKIVQQAPIFHIPKRQELKQQKQKIQMIFQDPYSSLNDRIAISEVIGEGLNSFPELYQNDETRKWFLANYNAQLPSTEKPLTLVDVKDKDVKYFLILHILQEVGLLPEHLSRYAHEFSGGQKQRIGIARALIMNPELVIADEPISALDVSIRAQILNLLKKFQSLNNLTYIFIAHDLSIVRFISDRIAVMYNGQIVELASAEELFTNPLHPYTKALLSAIAQPNPHYEKNRVHFVYQPEQEHYDYNYDLPDFIEVSANHYLYANKREITTLQNKKSTYLAQKGGD